MQETIKRQDSPQSQITDPDFGDFSNNLNTNNKPQRPRQQGRWCNNQCHIM